MTQRTCEAVAMDAATARTPEQFADALPPCNEPAVEVFECRGVEWHLCAGCAEALEILLGLFKDQSRFKPKEPPS